MMKKLIAMMLVAFMAISTAPITAHAGIDLATAKAQGLVGERPDGFVGTVDPATASADVKDLVKTTNAERREKYKEIAAKNGTSVDKVQAVAGADIIKRTPSGQYIMTAAGKWVKKR